MAARPSATRRSVQRRLFGIESLQAREMMAADTVEVSPRQVHQSSHAMPAMEAPLAEDRYSDRFDKGFSTQEFADVRRISRKSVFPIAEPDSFEINTNETLRGNVRANDFVIDHQGNDTSDVIAIRLSSGAGHGSLSLDESGQFKYTPDPGFIGFDSFSYVAISKKVVSEVAEVTIEVTEKDAPVTAPDEWVTEQGRSVKGNVLANDPTAMAADRSSERLTAQLVDKPDRGDLKFNRDGDFHFTPDPDFIGIVEFTYVLNDGLSSSEPTRVTIHVQRRGAEGEGFQKTPRPDTAMTERTKVSARATKTEHGKISMKDTTDSENRFANSVDHIMTNLHFVEASMAGRD